MQQKLTKDQWGRVAEKIMELGNLIFIGLVITQIVPNKEINFPVVLTGIIAIFIAYYIAFRIMKGGRK